MNIILLSLIIITSLISPLNTDYDHLRTTQIDQIREMIEEVDISSDRAGNRSDAVRIRARAASLLWKIDGETGRRRFEQLWGWVDANITQPVDVAKARSDILRSLIQHDRRLAESWMMQVKESKAPSEPVSLSDMLNEPIRKSSIKLNLAKQLIEDDPALAAQLLGDVFNDGYSYQSHAVLRSLAEKDQQLADRVSDQLLVVLASQNNDRALIGVQHLFEYFYPRRLDKLQSQVQKIGGRDSGIIYRDSTIRQRFFQIASMLLSRSVERSAGLSQTPSERRLIETNQALLAIELNSVSSAQEGIDTSLINKLSDLARRLRPTISGELTGVVEAIERNGRQDQVPPATAQVDNVEKSANNNQTNLDSFRAQLELARYLSTIRAMITRRNLSEALSAILSINESLPRLILLGEIGRAVRDEKEPHFWRYLSTLTLRTANDLPHSERKVEILLTLLQSEPSWQLLDGLIESLNGLPHHSERLLTGNAFRQAFMSTIKLDKESAFDKIKEIRSVSFELMARLALCEALLNQLIHN